MNITDLNQDVLMTIASHVGEKRDVLSLVLSCKALYEAGTSVLLEEIVLRRTNQVFAFCKSITRDHGLARHIRAFELAYMWLPDDHLDETEENEEGNKMLEYSQEWKELCTRLTELISHISNLRKLKLATAEITLNCSQALSDALGACRHLETLRLEERDKSFFDGLGEGTWALMKKLHAPLREVSLILLSQKRSPEARLSS